MRFRSLLIGAFAALTSATQAGGYAVYQSDSSFVDVMDGLKLAIEERGMYINNVMHIGEMLERTGKDLGMNEPIYTQANSIEFCSAVLSRKMAAENPEWIINCPFVVAVYTLPDRSDITYVVHHAIPPDQIENSAVMKEVAEMLRGVAESAVSW
ncbi:MAG: DUF302 domain-containing protein [Thiohalocapsa sp. PB-PSB1]|jgi:uncharacterized protein (DUF302 family)|nr:MAG: hypothetical protein N838_10975 [Thiohalocapsa sp. PB-PSB1]QQO56480.1 MAG: DUF302 domain-containing protein [Thiohalocapsa sp. PB-PSB1]HCS91005.1 DUF302 domain-containing protein [Chromatiaceae bacterium]